MASVKSDSTAIIITLILFVVLSIVLGVTTFIFYKGEEDAIIARERADEDRAAAEDKASEVQKKVDNLKQLVGAQPDPAEPSVEMIVKDFGRHQNVYGETYNKNKEFGIDVPTEAKDAQSSTYPLMLKYLIDANEELHGWIVQRDTDMTEIKKNHAAEKEKLVAAHEETKGQLNDISAKVQTVQEQFDSDRATFEDKYKTATDDLREAQDKIATIQDTSRKKLRKITENMNEQDNQLKATRAALSNSRKIDLEAPDGEVIWVNQVDGTVYVNLGRYDGLRRQTTFSVYPQDVSNALNAKPKGTLEIVHVGENMSVAKVTSDQLSNKHLLNPILKGDKIISAVFHRGQPEHFAIAGKIDIDGDTRSDLPLLLRLIEQNGGVVDVFVDNLGKVGGSGTITPRTKFLVMGEKPTDKSEEQFLNAYNKMVQAAVENGVRIMPLKDLLDHMGYEGQGRSVGLGRTANPDDFKPTGESEVFRRRPAG